MGSALETITDALLLSAVAFNFNLRRYSSGRPRA
jgi:hypothetical protein